MQHRFAAEPVFSKTGKGFLISEGVENSPAFGKFGFRLERKRGQFLILIHEAPKATLPAPALRANCAINAAFAKVWSAEFNEPGWCLPYVVDGSAAGGEALLGILDGFLATPSNDRRVIQAWADHLGIGHWLKRIQYSP